LSIHTYVPKEYAAPIFRVTVSGPTHPHGFLTFYI